MRYQERCGTGARQCVVSGPQPMNTLCGTQQACDGMGACQPCGGINQLCCNTACVMLTPPVVFATCTAGFCGALSCNSGFHVCGRACVSSSSTDSCGSSCQSCPTYANASPTCDGSACGFECNDGYSDCDGDRTNGCETPVRSDAHCGLCAVSCPGGTTCVGAACQRAAATCPSGVRLGTFDDSLGGWTVNSVGSWRASAGAAVLGPAGGVNYSFSLTSPLAIDLRGCATGRLSYRVRFQDFPQPGAIDASERLAVQCSGDNGASWLAVTPETLPDIQRDCGGVYCSGNPVRSRTFFWVLQRASLPPTCLGQTRIRFLASGRSGVGSFMSLVEGWSVDDVALN
jgi:hypothetical protein